MRRYPAKRGTVRKRSKGPEVRHYPDSSGVAILEDGTVRARLPIVVDNPTNSRRDWRKTMTKVAAERDAVRLVLGTRLPCKHPPSAEYLVTFTRIAPRLFDDDNLRTAFKGPRDEVAALMGLDDKEGSGIQWRYQQRTGRVKEYAIEIEVRRLTHEDRCPTCSQIVIKEAIA